MPATESATVNARVNGRLLRLAVLAAVATVMTGAMRLVVQAAATGATDPGALLQVVSTSSFGGHLLARGIAATALAVLILVAASYESRVHGPESRRRRLVTRAFGALLLGAVVVLDASTGHLAAAEAGQAVGIAIGAAPLAAAGVWIGGLIALTVGVLPIARGTAAERSHARAMLRRFGILAAGSLLVMAFTGLLAMGQLVATPDALLTSGYGQVLLLKVALAACVGILGLLNLLGLRASPGRPAARLVPRRAGVWLRRRDVVPTVRLEALGAIAVVAVVALLGATPPARGPAFDPIPASALYPSINGTADDLLITMEIRPNRPGPNFVSIGVFDTRRPAPAPISEVTLVLVGPGGSNELRITTRPTDDGRYDAGGDWLDQPGEWHIAVLVGRAGMSVARLGVPWVVYPSSMPTTARQIILSDRPLAGIAAAVVVFMLAAVALVLGGVIAGRVMRRRSGGRSTSAGRRRLEWNLTEREPGSTT